MVYFCSAPTQVTQYDFIPWLRSSICQYSQQGGYFPLIPLSQWKKLLKNTASSDSGIYRPIFQYYIFRLDQMPHAPTFKVR